MKTIERCNRFAYCAVVPLLTAIVAASAHGNGAAQAATGHVSAPDIVGHRTVEWTDLIPEEDLEALLNPPDYVTEVEDGSLEDRMSSELQNALTAAADDRYQAALASTRVKSELEGQAVRLPGFIVPLEYNDERQVTQFFLVPYFGACIHLPPPPPNQIVWVEYPRGLELPDLYQPFWLSGVLSTTITEDSEATSAYAMHLQRYELYEERYEESAPQ